MRKMVLLLLLSMLVACGQAVTGSQPPVTTAPATSPAPATIAPEPTSQAATAAPSPVPTPGVTAVVGPDDRLVRAVHQALARQLGAREDTLRLQSAVWQEWPDGAIGCPQEGMVYPQVITPGFLLTFSDGTRTYEVHTDEGGRSMVWCENEQPIELSGGEPAGAGPEATPQPDAASQPLVDMAKQALAKDLGIASDDIRLVAIEAVEWNDSSLGCPQPDQAYLQVITPGYRIVLETQGQRYEYHTDQRGTVVRCDAPQNSSG